MDWAYRQKSPEGASPGGARGASGRPGTLIIMIIIIIIILLLSLLLSIVVLIMIIIRITKRMLVVE